MLQGVLFVLTADNLRPLILVDAALAFSAASSTVVTADATVFLPLPKLL